MTPDDRERRGEDDDGLSNLASAYQQAGPYLAASTTLVASVGLFAAAGWWIDGKVGTEKPWFLHRRGAFSGWWAGSSASFGRSWGKQKK